MTDYTAYKLTNKSIGPAHEILDIMAYSQKHPINAHGEVFNETRGLKFGLSLHLHLYSVHASNKGSGESAHMPRLTRAFVTPQCDNSTSNKSHVLAQLVIS